MQAVRTLGLSPKLVSAAIVGALTYAVTKLGLQWDPQLEQAINAVAMLVATYVAPPGDVVVEKPELPDDEAVPGE